MQARPHLVPAAGSALLLLVALGDHPYGYYTFLRWVVCLTAAFVAVTAYRGRPQLLAWPFAGVAVLFNPFSPVFLQRDTWKVIDVCAALGFLIGGTVVTTQTDDNTSRRAKAR